MQMIPQSPEGGQSATFENSPQSPRKGPVQWWFRVTSVPNPPASASFLKREAARKARLVSIIVFSILLLFVIYFTASLFLTPLATLTTLPILPVALAAILLNRKEKPVTAGIVIVVACEVSLAVLVLMTTPLDATSIDLYERLVIGSLLAGALLPAQAIFYTGIFNSVIVTISLLVQVRTPAWNQMVHLHFAEILLNQVGIQLMVAIVTYLWVSSALRAIARADRAEVVISLERRIAQQTAQVVEEKQRLEEAIHKIVQSYIDMMNTKQITRIPFSEDTKTFWPLINVIESLQKRLHSSLSSVQRSESELQQLKRAIAEYTSFFDNGGLKQSSNWQQTKTDLDELLFVLQRQLPLVSSGSPHASSNQSWDGLTSAMGNSGVRPISSEKGMSSNQSWSERGWHSGRLASGTFANETFPGDHPGNKSQERG